MIVYADVLFLVNFIMDFFCLHISLKILHINAGNIRKVLSSLLGAVFSVVKLYIKLPEPVFALCISVLMCVIVLKNIRFSLLVKLLLLFYVVCAVFGGGMTFLYNTAFALKEKGILRDNLSPVVFFIFAGMVYFTVYLCGRIFSNNIKKKTVDITVTVGEKSKSFHLLYDSGNLLCCPYTGLPVIIISQKGLYGLLGENMDFLNGVCDNSLALRIKLRYIPTKTAVGEGVLPAFLPDKLTALINNEQIPIEGVIAIDGNNKDTFNGFDGIIGNNALPI